MENDNAVLSKTSSVLEDVVTSNENNSGEFVMDMTANVWRYGWPPLCVTGLIGNTLVLLILWRDGLARTSANVYLSALAVGDSLVLVVASLVVYPGYGWGWWLDETSILACRATWPIHNTLVNASTWLIVAFTVERCFVVCFPLHKLRLCTPRNAGLCCVSLLVLAFLKNIDLFFINDLVIDTDSGDLVCEVPLRYQDYLYSYRTWISIAASCVIPTGVLLVCNWAIIRTLRWELMQTAVRDSIVRRTTFMCLAASFGFIVCVVPVYVFVATIPNWPIMLQNQYDVWATVVLLQYANHAVNFFLYSLTGAHFRCELVALFRSCIQRGRTTTAVVRRMTSRVTSGFQFRRDFEQEYVEMY